ncbi:MAG: hypothetical protein AAF799_29735 [Myxococcota bacterium]
MRGFWVSLSIIAALASGCAYDAEPDTDAGEPGRLRIDVDAEALDSSRIRIGLFRTDGPGTYTTADGVHSGTIRLRLLVGDGDRVRVSAFDERGEVDEARLESIAVPAIQSMTLAEFDDGDAPFDLERDDLASSMIPLVWYDHEFNDALNIAPAGAGESETARGLVDRERDPQVTLSSLELRTENEGSAESRRVWTMWGTDTTVGMAVLDDWSIEWTAVLETQTEVR